MTALVFSPFGGIFPRYDAATLPANAAQVAENCRVSSGTLEPFSRPLQVYDPTMTGVQTIYRFGQASKSDTDYWLTFKNVVDVVKGAIANDTEERTYYTGDGAPKVTKSDMALNSRPYPTASYRLGIPAPTTAPGVTVSGSPSSSTAIAEERVYVQTFVSVLDEESAPSGPSNSVSVADGQTVSMFLASVPSGPYKVDRKRIYRTVTGSASTQYLFVAEVAAGATTFTDTVEAADLGEVMPSLEYELLPDAARGLVAMPNGMMAAHTDYDVYFCVPYKPYAWPVSFMQTVDYPVVGLGAFGSSLAVLTTGLPYVMTGADPSSVSVEKLSTPYPCVSKRSIVSALNGVVYASANGLAQIDATGIKIITEAYFTRREWQALNPASMLCAVWDDRIFVFYNNGTEKGGFILSADGLTTTDVFATAAFTDPVTGALFLCVNDKIVKWDAGLAGQFRWRSRRNLIMYPQNYAVGQVLAQTYPLTVRIYADGLLRDEKNVTSAMPFRLSAGFRATFWELEIVGGGRVSMAALANEMEDLTRV